MNPTAAATLDLRDIHAAAAPPFWPPAPGWWLLAVLLIALLFIGSLWLLRRYKVYRLNRQVMHELDALTNCVSKDNIVVFLSKLSILLRRVALRHYAREQVASLTGSAWLRFLDATGGTGDFEHGVGQVLEVGPYCLHPQELPAEELLALARRWVKHNLKVAT